MMQMSFNVKPTLIEELKHDMRTDERVLRWIAVKDRALRPLKAFPARDPRNPLNIAAMNKDQWRRRHRPREAHESTTRRLTSRGKGYHPSQFPKSHPASVEKVRRTNRPRAPRLQATFPPGSAFRIPARTVRSRMMINTVIPG